VDRLTSETLGAWVLKCNPDVYDLPAALAAGEPQDSWLVVDNYRTHMMRQGQPVVIWVTGSEGAHPEPGVWMVGHVAEEAFLLPDLLEGEVDDPDAVLYWLDTSKAVKGEWWVPIEVEAVDPVLPRAVIQADPRLRDMELLRIPAMSNPSYLTRDEFAALRDLLAGFPEPLLDQGEEIAADVPMSRDPVTRRLVELRAIGAVIEWYVEQGWDVEDVSSRSLGWDLTCSRADRNNHHVEVKGLASGGPAVLLTANEVARAADTQGWRLAVVRKALDAEPTTEFYDAAAVVESARPTTFRVALEQ